MPADPDLLEDLSEDQDEERRQWGAWEKQGQDEYLQSTAADYQAVPYTLFLSRSKGRGRKPRRDPTYVELLRMAIGVWRQIPEDVVKMRRLDVLAQECGYDNVEDFSAFVRRQPNPSKRPRS